MDSLLNRIRRSLAQRGWVGTAQMCWIGLRPHVLPSWREREARRRQIDAEFDRLHGVETAGSFRPRPEDVVAGENWAYCNHYEAVEPGSFADALGRVSIPHAEFTFLDFGSGKGRCLLLASGFPFRKIVGVEFCRELNRVARENLKHYPASARSCREIEIVDADATQYAIPTEPVVLFMNNPFAAPLMTRVVQNVKDSFLRNPRRIVIIYFWPFFAALWDAVGFLKRIHGSPAIFDTGPIGIAKNSAAASINLPHLPSPRPAV